MFQTIRLVQLKAATHNRLTTTSIRTFFRLATDPSTPPRGFGGFSRGGSGSGSNNNTRTPLRKPRTPPKSTQSPPNKPNGNVNNPFGNQSGLIGIGITAAITWLLYQRGKKSMGDQGTEIDWQSFRTHFLAAGDVERLVVVNKSICRVYLRPRGMAPRTTTTTNTNSDSPDRFVDPASMPRSSTNNTTSQQQQIFYFNLGSIENFERKLEDAQRELGIQPHDFIPVQYTTEFAWIGEVAKFLPTLVMLGIWVYLFRGNMGGGGGGMNQIFKIAKSPAKLFGGKDGAKVTTKFTDVAGCEEAKGEIAEFVDFLKAPKRFIDVGAKIPRGALLWGPPGTGKTLLAKAVAGEASVPFFSISGSDFIEMFVGVGASRVRDTFNEARLHAPCIVFIDEIDAVARARGKGAFGGNDERESTLNQLLVELDGFNTKEGVVVLAATNRLDILDPAILRPGRFDRQIKVDLPHVRGRMEIFKVHLRHVKIEGGEAEVENTAQRLAALTPGFSGAEIANVINEAAIFAARESSGVISATHFDRAVDRVIGGLERKNAIMTPEERRMVAYHEAGHALAGWFLEHADPLLKVTIVPRISGALGYAQYLPKEVSLYSRPQLEDTMCMALGGRAAEDITFGTVTTGAQDDLKKVTQIAYNMVSLWGMSDKIGQLSYPREQADYGVKQYSNATNEMIDAEARRIVDDAFTRVRNLLSLHKKELVAVAERLLEKEAINQHDITELVGQRKWKLPSTYEEFVAAGTSSKQQEEKEKKKVVDKVPNIPVVEPAL